jgi:hypothetical protein
LNPGIRGTIRFSSFQLLFAICSLLLVNQCPV